MYTIDYFINKFEAIAEDKWHMGNYQDEKDPTKYCALGHCGVQESNGHHTEESKALYELVKLELGEFIHCINDGVILKFPQYTPKQRVLAALYQIKAKNESKVIIEYKTVEVDSKVKQLAKEELILN